ncbi:MAG TPA: TrmJ/YjtD family RNA methyltransferase [Acidobacteriaceae bacterium]|nr:TrmJ/YjtD family RNA methyltransferase [Acidobacteriaceae bacterium]
MAFDPDRLSVVLVSTRNPLNIGAAARAMCNFGFRHLRVVNPYEASFREARSAVGAASILTNAGKFETVTDAIADCTLVVGTTALGDRQPQHLLNTLAEGAAIIAQELHNANPTMHRVAILFGSEKVGLSNDDLSRCHWLMHIPTREEQPSMNLGQAVAVCLYELIRSENVPATFKEKIPASASELERMTSLLLETLRASTYLNADPSNEKQMEIRRLVRRLDVSSEDSATLLGMLRQTLWKLRKDGPQS